MAKKTRCCFISDIHLNHCGIERIRFFCDSVNDTNSEIVLLTGDISEAPCLIDHLTVMAAYINAPIYYVLGNHDFYNGSIKSVLDQIKGLDIPNLFFLPSLGSVTLPGTRTALVGHNGWYDGGYANWFSPNTVNMCDYSLITELKVPYTYAASKQGNQQQARFEVLNQLAEECAEHIRTEIPKAFKTHDKVIFLTHVPPFRENSVYKGEISNDKWMPCFSSKRAGDALLKVIKTYPDKELTVLCGHSHGGAYYKPLENLECYTAYSEYCQPWLSIKVLDL